jgi:hypothetical protein
MTFTTRRDGADDAGAEGPKKGDATMKDEPTAPRAVNLAYELAMH